MFILIFDTFDFDKTLLSDGANIGKFRLYVNYFFHKMLCWTIYSVVSRSLIENGGSPIFRHIHMC